METLATLHILCLNLVPCKFEIQFNLTEWLSWNVCCHPAYRNFLSDSWFDSWVGQRRQNQEAASTNSFKVYNASIKNTTSPQGHPKSSFVAKCLSSVHNVCKLDGSAYPGPVSTWKSPSKRCLSSCDWHFLARFLFWSLHIPPIGLWQSALWQRWSIIHHQGGWHESEYALWDKFLSATRHKLDSYSFRSIISTNLSATIFAVKHTCQTEWLDSTNKT